MFWPRPCLATLSRSRTPRKPDSRANSGVISGKPIVSIESTSISPSSIRYRAPTFTCGRVHIRTLHVISPRRTPSRRRLVNIMPKGLLQASVRVRMQTKNGPRFRRGPSCLGSLVLRELFWRPYGRGAVGAERSLRGVAARLYGRSAPVKDATPWGDVESWAAKLFSINRICTLLALTRSGLAFSSPPGVSSGALPRAT